MIEMPHKNIQGVLLQMRPLVTSKSWSLQILLYLSKETIIHFMHRCQRERVLNEFTAIMWSMEWVHSTAVRPNKSPTGEGRFPEVHSYTFLNNWTKNSGSVILWSQNSGWGQTLSLPGSLQKWLCFRYNIASLEIMSMWFSHDLS